MLYALGAVSAAHMGVTINWGAYLLGQVAVTSIQLMGQYLNEYVDIEVDRLGADNRTWFSGGSGILPKGAVLPSTVMAAAVFCGGAAILTGIFASIHSPWMIPIVTTSLLGSWFYSAASISLMSSGWGELSTSIIVALLVPLAGYYMQSSYPPIELWLIGVSLVLIHTAMLISFEFPDRTADLSVGKKTLTVRLGFQRAAWLANGLIGCAYLILTLITVLLKYPGWWMGLAIPLSIWQMVMFHRVILSPTHTHYHILTTGGVGLFALMSLLALFGFMPTR